MDSSFPFWFELVVAFNPIVKEEFIVKGKTLSILEENTDYLYDFWVGEDFLNKAQKGFIINHCC